MARVPVRHRPCIVESMSAQTTDPFEEVLAQLLEPLARAMVARGVSLQAATLSMKQALLRAAVAAEGEDVSDSRVSLLTGLHRKDVKAMRSASAPKSARRTTNAIAMTASYWATAPEYQGLDGATMALPREGEDGAPGVYDIIRRTRVDMAPGTVLTAMQDHGAVSEGEDGLFELQTQAFLPDSGSAAMIEAYRATIGPHLAAATHNLIASEGEARTFDRVVRYSHLSQESVASLNAMAEDQAQALLERLNAVARDLQEQDADSGARGRFSLGAYVWPVYPETEDDT